MDLVMAERRITVGLIDGPLEAAEGDDTRWFCDEEASAPASAHAAAIATAIRAHAPEVRFKNAVIFGPRLATGRAAVRAALAWFAEDPPEIIHCSFGLPGIDTALAEIVARLIDAGVAVVASAPARGQLVAPAALPGVLAVQGDARCGPDDLSCLDTDRADFGAHVIAPGVPPIHGASAAAAHVTGFLAAELARTEALDEAVSALRLAAKWHGPERRSR